MAILALFLCGFLAASAAVKVLFPLKYEVLVEENCERFGVSKSLVYAVIHTESGFDASARSNVGAMGLMQIMPETFIWLCGKLEPQSVFAEDALYIPEINIRYGVYLLSILEKQYDSETLAIAAYHAGMGSVDKWLENELLTPDDAAPENIPSRTTGHYVYKVERAEFIYRQLLGQ